jgi:hypothetical protein
MRPLRSLFGLLFLAFAVAPMGACSNQGEGQRCDKNSGDSDCAAGLICTTIQTSTTQTTIDGGSTTATLPAAVCCPERSATTDICRAVGSAFDAGPPTPDNSGGQSSSGGAGGVDAAAGAGGTSGAGGAAESGGTAGTGGVAESGAPKDAGAGGSTPDASIDASGD